MFCKQRILSSEVSVQEISKVFVEKKGLNVEESSQMYNSMMQLGTYACILKAHSHSMSGGFNLSFDLLSVIAVFE
jgi:hypothetical protein